MILNLIETAYTVFLALPSFSLCLKLGNILHLNVKDNLNPVSKVNFHIKAKHPYPTEVCKYLYPWLTVVLKLALSNQRTLTVGEHSHSQLVSSLKRIDLNNKEDM